MLTDGLRMQLNNVYTDNEKYIDKGYGNEVYINAIVAYLKQEKYKKRVFWSREVHTAIDDSITLIGGDRYSSTEDICGIQGFIYYEVDNVFRVLKYVSGEFEIVDMLYTNSPYAIAAAPGLWGPGDRYNKLSNKREKQKRVVFIYKPKGIRTEVVLGIAYDYSDEIRSEFGNIYASAIENTATCLRDN